MTAVEEFDLNPIDRDVPLPRSNSFVPSKGRLSLVTNLSNRQPMFARCHRLSLIITDSIQDPVIIAFLIRVSSVSHPWLKRIGKTEPRIYTDFHGFDPRAKSVVDRSAGHSPMAADGETVFSTIKR